MTLRIQDAGTLRTITNLTIKQAGVNRRIRTLKVMDGSTLRTVATFADPLSLSITPNPVTALEDGAGTPRSLTTDTASAVRVGGLSPFTYAWTFVSGDSATINSPSLASTTFKRTVASGEANSGVFRCTVTDSTGATATADVTANFANSEA